MKISKQTKEIINIVLFLLVIGSIVTVYIIYPLGRTNAQMGRVDIDEFNEDSLAINNPDFFINANLPADTFYFEPDGLTKLACLSINHDSAIGTVILLHNETQTRDSLLDLAALLYENSYSIIIYDQRASGYSSGKYHSGGYNEAADLMEMISTMEIREKILHPLYVAGFGIGADACLMAAAEEKRIDALVAVNPYFTTKRMQDIYKEKYDTYWFPFYRTIMWWWFKMRSSYAPPYLEEDDIQAVTAKTLLVMDEKYKDCNELKKFIDISNKDNINVEFYNQQPENLNERILSFLKN